MQHVRLGRTGLQVSRICLGTMTFGLQVDEDGSRAILDHADALGITFLDAADVYPLGGDLKTAGRTEEILGRWLQGRRDQFVVATKCFGPMGTRAWDAGNSRRHIMDAVDASLRRLQTYFIDLYQLHFDDRNVPLEESLQALDDLVRAGKVRYLGVSNFSGWHLMQSLLVSEKNGLARYVANQAYYSLIGRDYEWELMPLGLKHGLGAVVWSPLGWGRLTGKIRRGQPLPATTRLKSQLVLDMGPPVDNDYLFQVVDALDAVASETGKTVPQIALNWLLQRPTVANLIIGARNEEQLRQNLGALGWNLPPAQVAKLDAASARPKAYPYWHQDGFAERNPPPV